MGPSHSSPATPSSAFGDTLPPHQSSAPAPVPSQPVRETLQPVQLPPSSLGAAPVAPAPATPVVTEGGPMTAEEAPKQMQVITFAN